MGCFTYPGRRVRQWEQEVQRDLRQHKEQSDFPFCWLKSKFPLVCSPKNVTLHGWAAHGWVPVGHCCRGSQPCLSGGGLDWWKAPGWCFLGHGVAAAFQHAEHTSGLQLGSRRGPRVSPGSCTGGSCSQLGSEDPTLAVALPPCAPKERTLFPSVPPGTHCHSRAPSLVPCRTAATAAAGTRSVWPALPGSSRIAGDTTAASPACPVPSSTASRSPTAPPRPTPSVGSACQGERDQPGHSHAWGQAGRGWAQGASPEATHGPTCDLRGVW